MGRMTFSDALMRGVEYDLEEETVYVDVSTWSGENFAGESPRVVGTCLFMVIEVLRQWYPAYRVRRYIVKGVG